MFQHLPKIIVILGQTATGKSDLAVKIAKKVDGEIISTDSRQVYKGLDVGTGKITPDTKNSSNFSTGQTQKKYIFTHKGIPHYLIDVANPKKQFTVAEYKKLADKKIQEIIAQDKIPIICGGTGFYIDAVTKDIVFPEVPPNNKLRKSLLRNTTVVLFRKLQNLDPERAKNIDPKNRVRLIRAIEIAKILGKVPPVAETLPPYKFIKIGLYLPPDKLKKKVEKRVKKMFDDGLLDEIKKLKKVGVSNKRLQELGFEYFNPTYEKVVKETLQYAKRQMTWFKRDKEIRWFDASKKINLKKIF